MFRIVLGIFLDLVTGGTRSRSSAVEAFENPPRTLQAHRYRWAALGLFMTFSALLLSAAVVFVVDPQNKLHEWLGWSGIMCLQLCVLCGLRYAQLNHRRPA